MPTQNSMIQVALKLMGKKESEIHDNQFRQPFSMVVVVTSENIHIISPLEIIALMPGTVS